MSLKDELAQAIEDWIGAKKNSSLNLLSKLSGVSYTTVLRVAQKEVEPSFKAVALLLPVLMPKEKHGDKAARFLLKHFPEMGYFVTPGTDDEIEPLEEVASLDNFSQADFVTLSLAATSGGVTKDRIKAKLGENGLASLSKLETAGIIFVDEGRYFTTKRHFQVPGSDRVLTEIGWLTELFNFELINNWGSFYRLKTEGLSDEAVVKIHKLLKEFDQKIEEIVQNPANHGPNVMGYGIVSTYLDAKNGGVK